MNPARIRFPEYWFRSEEVAFKGNVQSPGHVWVIDLIYGTASYAHRHRT